VITVANWLKRMFLRLRKSGNQRPAQTRRSGVTLAEALVMIIVAGNLMIPVIGTLQNGLERTNAYSHQDRMRTIAQSELTRILAESTYLRQPIVDYIATKTWPIDDPQPVATYVMEVKMLENIRLATLASPGKGDFPEPENMIGTQPTNLKTVVVTVTYLPDEGDTVTPAQIRLFSMIAIPRSFNPNRVFIADKDNICIYAIDPKTRNVVETFDLPRTHPNKTNTANHPYRPGNIAVHPNSNWVLTQRKTSLLLTDVAVQSPTRRTSVEVYATSTLYLKDPTSNDEIRKDRGVAFRPDGRYCYVTSNSPAGLSVYSVPDTFGTIFALQRFFPIADDKFVDLQVGDDGYIYIGDYNYDSRCFRRLNMYAPIAQAALEDYALADWTTGSNPSKHAIAACPSRDGRDVYAVWEGGLVSWSPSDNPATWTYAQITTPTSLSGEDLQDIQVTGDNTLAVVSSKRGGGNTRIYGLSLPMEMSKINPWSTPNQTAYPGSGDVTNQVILSPTLNEIWVDRKSAGTIYAIDDAGLAAGSYTTPIPPSTSGIPDDRTITFVPNGDAGCVTAKPPELVAVGCSNLSGVNSVEFIDPYAKFHYEDLSQIASFTPSHLAFNGAGSRLSACYNIFSSLPAEFDVFTQNNPAPIDPAGWGVTADRRPTHHVYFQNGGRLILKCGTSTGNNGYLAFDKNGVAHADVDFNLTASMSDVVALNDGGALVLVNDFVNNWTRLDRIGPDAEVWTKWDSRFDNFPPQGATKMAVSPDDSLLALYNPRIAPTGSVKRTANMTSPSTPAPNNIIVSQGSGWEAFDGDPATQWSAATNMGAVWITYDFGSPACINSLSYIVGTYIGTPAPNVFVIEGSNDNTTYTTLYSGSGAANFSWQTYTFPNTNTYRYYRLNVANTHSSAWEPTLMITYYHFAIKEMYFGGSSPVIPESVKVFDLRSNDFGKLTQQKGLISDYRNDISGNFATAVLPGYTMTGTTYKLIDNFTPRHALANMRDYPANYYFDNSGYFSAGGSCNRFFGYLRIPDAVTAMTLSTRDASRFFLEPTLTPYQDAAWGSLGELTGAPHTVSLANGPRVQFEHMSNDALTGMAPFYSTVSGAAVGCSGVEHVSGNAITDLHPLGTWKRIPTDYTTPLRFTPQCLKSWSDASPNTNPNRYYLCYSRDVASPTLYILNAETSKLYAVPFGDTVISSPLAASITANAAQGMAITPDGQRLMIAAKNPSPNRVYLVDISTPAQASFMKVIAHINLPMPPTCIAARPFNRLNSKKNTYEVVANLPDGIGGNNQAAVASGGIYYFGEQAAILGAVSQTVLQFNPMLNSVAHKAGKLPKAVHDHAVFAYDGDLYALNGMDSSGNALSYVQRWNPTTNSSLTSYEPPLPSGLTHRWQFDENTSTTAADSVGGQNGTLDGTVGWVPGKFGSAVSLSGSAGCKVSVSADTSLNLTSPFTVALWVKPTELPPTWEAILGKYSSSATPNYAFSIWTNNGNGSTGDLEIWYDSTCVRAVSSFFAINSWVHIAITYNGSNLVIYKNGTQVSNTAESIPGANAVSMAFGARSSSDDTYNYQGHIDDVQYYNRALSAAEVSVAMSGGATIASDRYMSKMVEDDAVTEIKRFVQGGTMTPYGYITGGGAEVGTTGGDRANCQVYWPHAIANYISASNIFYGLSRELPPIPEACHGLSFVYHKGYLYQIGGSGWSGALVGGVKRFDFATNTWTTLTAAADTDSLTDPTGLMTRYMQGARSFGNEIFVFGGAEANGTLINDPVAWNPDTKVVRRLPPIPPTTGGTSTTDSSPMMRTIGMTVIPCGPAIYLFGGGPAWSTGGSGQVLKYTP